MDYSEEIENSVPEQRLSPRYPFSKERSIIVEDKRENLRGIGTRVDLGNSEAYSFPFEKPPSQRAEISTQDSKKTFYRPIAEAHHGVRKVKISCNNVSSGDGKQDGAEFGKITPILELKLGSIGKKDKGFELFIKSEHNDRDFLSEEESFCSNSDYYDAEEHLNNFDKTNPRQQASPRIDSLHKTAFKVTPMNDPELSSKQTQTDKQFESSSTQTTGVRVTYPGKAQETTTQTDQKCNASTSPENQTLRKESTEVQTENILKKHVAGQTDTERITGASQTETAAIFSIERTYDASTQTDTVAEAATMTDFDIYMVDRTKMADKSTDTDDLPYAPLMVARSEKIKSNNLSINTTGSANYDDQELAATDGTPQGEIQFCFEKFKKKIDSLLTADIPESHNCKCKTYDTDLEDAKLPKPPVTLRLKEVDYSSVALKDNLTDPSKVEIVKHLAYAFNEREIFAAVRVQSQTKFEKAAVFNVPVVIKHFLNVFSFPARKTHRVLINPIKISTGVARSPDSGMERDVELDTISKPSPIEERISDAQTLGILDVTRGKSVIVSSIPKLRSADDKHSKVCLCDSCYDRVQNVIERKQKHEKSGQSPPKLDKLHRKDEAKRKSTTPKLITKNFDYSVRDAWEPKKWSQEAFFSEKVEAVDIINIPDSDSDSDHSTESLEEMNLYAACEIVNDHLLNLRQVDEGSVQKAAQTLHRAWFEIVGSKHTDLEAVKFYIRYFEEFSNNLLKTLLHSTDSRGNNVLHFAFANNRFDLVEELLNNGYAAELLKKTNQTGNSPLVVCSISMPTNESDWSVVRRSFELGDVNGQSLKSGGTPLMNAVSCGYEAMVSLLLEVGANPNLQDKDGSTALMYAAEHGQERCAKMLMRHEACDPTIKDEDGHTACSIALSNGHKNIAVLIHMQALEKRQLSKHFHSIKRYVWTSKGSETESNSVKPTSHSVHS